MKVARESVRFRVLCTPAAPKTYQGKATEFGLRRKDGILAPGKERRGWLAFEGTIEWAENGKTKSPRFYGDCVFKSGDESVLHIRWRHRGSNGAINNVKIRLEVDLATLQKANKLNKVIQTQVSTPQWGVHDNWHGLGMGKDWKLVAK